MALSLGFRYLWTDSLCIIQDSEADWASDSSNMGRIYKSAALNIAATGFYNGKNDLFVSRHPKGVLPLRLEVENSPAKSTVYDPDHAPSNSYFMMERYQWETQVVESPLNQRGWVFQERLLSPRILRFGNEQLLWECHEMSCSEIFPSGFPHHIENDLKPKRSLFEPSPLTVKRLATIFDYFRLETYQESVNHFYRSKLYEQWWTSVSTCGAGLLTRPGDKLPALSGAAKEMRALPEDEYVAGLWRKDLLKQLLCSIEPKTAITRPSRYRAPSWSWAAVDGQVRMTHPLLNEIDVSIAEINRSRDLLCQQRRHGLPEWRAPPYQRFTLRGFPGNETRSVDDQGRKAGDPYQIRNENRIARWSGDHQIHRPSDADRIE